MIRRDSYLDLMTESEYRRLLAEHEAALARLGEFDESTEFGAGFVYDPEKDGDDAIDCQIATAITKVRR